jgi:hypothetical protein
MALTWTTQIDFMNDGTFTSAGDDISAYVENYDIQLGNPSPGPLALSASAGQCILSLNNTDKRFSPANTSSPYAPNLVPGRPVRIQVSDGTTTWIIFRGFTRSFGADNSVYGPRKATIECVDYLRVLQDSLISIPLQENISSDLLIRHIVNTALLAPAATGKITLSVTPSNNDTVATNGTTYTYKTSLSGAANEILINSLLGTLNNTYLAFNNSTGAGVSYGSNTTRPVGIATAINSPGGYDISNQNTGSSLRKVTGPKDKLAEQFQVDSSASISQVILYLQKSGAPTGTMTVRVETDNSGSPSGTLAFANGTGTLAESSLGAGLGLATFVFAGSIALLSGVVYWIVLSTDRAASDVNFVTWGSDSTSPTYAYQNNSGGLSQNASVWSKENVTFCFYLGELSLTLTSLLAGAIGNSYTLSDSSAGITVSGATLTGGADYPISPAPSIMAGRQTFDIAADLWSSDKTNSLTAIQQVVNSEQGRFWAARDGTITFKNRDYQFTQVTASLAIALNADPIEIQGTMALEDLYNQIRIVYTPRATLATGVVAQSKGVIQVPGQSGTERWSGTVLLPGGGSTVVKLPFIDPATSRPMGAKSLISPLVASTDWTAFSNPDGSGSDITASLVGYTVFSLAINGNDVEVSIKNTALGPTYLSRLQVRGTGIVSYNPTTITQEDAASQATYRKRALSMSLPLPSGQNFAVSLAQYTLGRYKNPSYRVKSLSFQKQATINGVNLYSLEIGSAITLSDAQLGLSNARYLITGVRYKRAAGSNGDVTLNVWKLDDVTYWILGDPVYGVLGSTTRLAI